MSTGERDREILADHAVHVVGMVCGVLAAAAMLVWAACQLPPMTAVALAIYCVSLVAMLCCSGAYHMLHAPAWKPMLRRLDHAAIFIKIAGTYTPFALIKLGGLTGITLFAGVWIVALFGAAAKLLLAAQWDRLAIGVYLALGWSGVATLQPLTATLASGALLLLAVGGILYSVGVIFFLWERLPYNNAVWHAFVLAGTACHFGAVALAVAN